jgi:hypothetical protein
MGTRRYLIETRRELQFKRKDGWVIRRFGIDDCLLVNNFLKKQKGVGRPWGLV